MTTLFVKTKSEATGKWMVLHLSRELGFDDNGRMKIPKGITLNEAIKGIMVQLGQGAGGPGPFEIWEQFEKPASWLPGDPKTDTRLVPDSSDVPLTQEYAADWANIPFEPYTDSSTPDVVPDTPPPPPPSKDAPADTKTAVDYVGMALFLAGLGLAGLILWFVWKHRVGITKVAEAVVMAPVKVIEHVEKAVS